MCSDERHEQIAAIDDLLRAQATIVATRGDRFVWSCRVCHARFEVEEPAALYRLYVLDHPDADGVSPTWMTASAVAEAIAEEALDVEDLALVERMVVGREGERHYRPLDPEERSRIYTRVAEKIERDRKADALIS